MLISTLQSEVWEEMGSPTSALGKLIADRLHIQPLSAVRTLC